MEFQGHGGVMHFGISEGKGGGGVKIWKPSVGGYCRKDRVVVMKNQIVDKEFQSNLVF